MIIFDQHRQQIKNVFVNCMHDWKYKLKGIGSCHFAWGWVHLKKYHMPVHFSDGAGTNPKSAKNGFLQFLPILFHIHTYLLSTWGFSYVSQQCYWLAAHQICQKEYPKKTDLIQLTLNPISAWDIQVSKSRFQLGTYLLIHH